jgi:hypothetical protein
MSRYYHHTTADREEEEEAKVIASRSFNAIIISCAALLQDALFLSAFAPISELERERLTECDTQAKERKATVSFGSRFNYAPHQIIAARYWPYCFQTNAISAARYD